MHNIQSSLFLSVKKRILCKSWCNFNCWFPRKWKALTWINHTICTVNWYEPYNCSYQLTVKCNCNCKVNCMYRQVIGQRKIQTCRRTNTEMFQYPMGDTYLILMEGGTCRGFLGYHWKRSSTNTCQSLSYWHLMGLNKVSSVLDAQAYMHINLVAAYWKKEAL